MSTDQPTGRVAVVTGASSGNGDATARALAADGHRVALLARRADRIQALADELGDAAIAIEADVTDRESVVAAADRVRHELGGTDILVNNAGVMLTAPFSSDQRDEHPRMVETNLLGAITAAEVFLDQLQDGSGDLPHPVCACSSCKMTINRARGCHYRVHRIAEPADRRSRRRGPLMNSPA